MAHPHPASGDWLSPPLVLNLEVLGKHPTECPMHQAEFSMLGGGTRPTLGQLLCRCGGCGSRACTQGMGPVGL